MRARIGGVEIERASRCVTISHLDLTAFTPPSASIRVVCGKGTYIRTLVHDLGMLLGCGAHLTALRRVRCGALEVADGHTLDELQTLAESGKTLPLLAPAAALAGYPGVAVRECAWRRLANGVAPVMAEVDVAAELSAGTLVRLLSNGQLAAMASFAPGGAGGRPGDFALHKVFPEVILLA